MNKIIGILSLVLIMNISNIGMCSERCRFDQGESRFDQGNKDLFPVPEEQPKEPLHIPAGNLFAYSHKKKYKAYNSNFTDKHHAYLSSEQTSMFPLAIESRLIYKENDWYIGIYGNRGCSYTIHIKNMNFNTAFRLLNKKDIYAYDNQNFWYRVEGVTECLKKYFPQEPRVQALEPKIQRLKEPKIQKSTDTENSFSTKYPKVFQFIKGSLAGTVIGLSLVATDHYSNNMISHVFSQLEKYMAIPFSIIFKFILAKYGHL